MPTQQQQEQELIEEFEKLLNKTKTKRTLTNQTYDKTYYKENFEELLKLGQFYEKRATERIIKHFDVMYPSIYYNDDNKFDVKIDDITFEIKTDVKAITTNNIFIEFVCRNKPSGISITEAEYYIIIIPYKTPLYLMIEVDRLRSLINNKLYSKIFQPNKWNNYTGGYIFSVETFIKHSILI